MLQSLLNFINTNSQIAFYLLLLCGIVLSIYSYSYSNSVVGTVNYEENICTIKKIEILEVDIYCMNLNNFINVVKMPCVLAFVNVKSMSNVKFYRSFEEKLRVNENNVNVSRHQY